MKVKDDNLFTHANQKIWINSSCSTKIISKQDTHCDFKTKKFEPTKHNMNISSEKSNR